MGKNKICVLGLGYIGFPTALLLARAGYDVVGYDVAKDKIELIKQGKLPFEEKGLEELHAEASKNLKAVDKLEESDVFLIAVPTPASKDKKCDLSYVIKAAESIVPFLKKGNLVILESTVKPGTTIETVKPILEKSGLACGKDFYLAYVSEKAIPGNTIKEMIENTRIIGGFDSRSADITKELYSSFVTGKIMATDCTTAETVKLFENSFRDTNIALANEFAKISKGIRINVWEAIDLANMHPRVNIHLPGPGVGGHCIPLDPLFLNEGEYKSELIIKSRQVNDSMPEYCVELIEASLGKDKPTLVKDKPTIAVLGIAYKADVDDYRESPSLKIAELLKERGYSLKITDPYVKAGKLDIVPIEEALKEADCAVILTDHSEYGRLRPGDFSSMKNRLIIDTRNIVDKKSFLSRGYKVITLGDHK